MENKNNYKIRYKLVKFALEFGKKQAAREFKTTVQTVRRWVNRYNKEGLKGLDDQSRKPHYSPNKCPDSFEKKVIELRLQTKNTFGAKRLIERFDLSYSVGCVQRIINQHGLKRKKKTKRVKRNELWSIKKLMKVFEKIQIDVKELTDIPQYFSDYIRGGLPKYEFTARCVKTGAAFVCYAKANTAINAACFAKYILDHLKGNGFDISTIEIQTDNGPEFNACGKKKKGYTPFEFIVKHVLQVDLSHIPPASPTYNSDVETFHRLVEDEFYAIEPIADLGQLIRKSYTYLIDFNFLRKNSYKDNKTPFELAQEDDPQFSMDMFNVPPVLLEDVQRLYLDCLDNATIPDITRRFGRPDPFDLDPDLEVFARIAGHVSFDRSILSLGGAHVHGLHNLFMDR